MKKIILLLSLSIVLNACASSNNTINAKQEPEWVAKPSLAYAESDYITGLGHSDTRMKAENAALRAVANYIVQEISVQSTASSKTEISGSNMAQSHEINEEIISVSDISKIVGLGIKEVWYNSQGIYYALAVLNKAEASSFYSDKIRANSIIIEELREKAKENPSTIYSNKSYNQAKSIAEENAEYLMIMTTVDNARRKLLEMQSPSPATISAEAKADAKNINISIDMKGAYKDSVRGYIVSSFAQKGIEIQKDIATNTKYILNCSIEIADMPQVNGNKFVSYSLIATLMDRDEDKELSSISFAGRDGHATKQQAVDRALYYIKEYIHSEDFNKLFAW